ncbi:NEL-type E3 ubiquitin ligase domain-containing protein [Pseudomonas sp. NPDC087639]|uniref:NEL-type E3 ubiquitin ligase domain-containing protein n=1 Tax=Pseudomonas sp. NPDC087639 TaxID=3364445 RepID=UPI0037FC372A
MGLAAIRRQTGNDAERFAVPVAGTDGQPFKDEKMSPRLPLKGTVEIHTRPTQQGPETVRHETPQRVDFGPTTAPGVLGPEGFGRVAGNAAPDAITPLPAITIHELPATVAVFNREQRPLAHYWITVPPDLPAPNADGFRVRGRRRYVDVPDGGTVLVGVDPDTGQYRARLSTERDALGPVLLRDTESGLWRPQESLPPTSTTTDPGNGGLLRPDGGQVRPAHRRLREQITAIVNRLRSPQTRAKRLFRSMSEEQIAAYLRSLGSDVEGGLRRREAEYQTLKQQLTLWSNASSSTPGTAKGWAEQIANEIKRCYRQETGPSLKLEAGSGTLPALKADFSHVRELSLESVTWSPEADTFLSSFSHLEQLTVTRSTLDKLPASVARMHDLTRLDLSANRIRLDTPAAVILGTLGKLENLNLSDNPLNMSPDFSTMTGLKVLNLSNAQLGHWPTGLQNQTGLQIVDLRNNSLQEVPQTLLNPPAEQLEASVRTNGVTLIEGNAFAPGYWKTLELYWRRLAADHPELSSSAHPQGLRLNVDIPELAKVQRMYPDKDAQAVRDFVLQLGDAELARRLRDFDSLEAQLEDYVAGKQYDASVDAATVRLWAPQRVARIIKTCWLQESGEILRLPTGSGPLPALTADFSHVRLLELQAINWSDTGDTFLSNFTHLESLSINHSSLRRLPACVGDMDKLIRLDLSSNSLELDEQSAARLSGLSRLKFVNLSENPLKTVPDFSAMSELTNLDLNSTGIDQWPTGLVGKAALTGLDLRNNQLTEVPQAIINPEPEQLASIARINGATLLEGNDFPSDYWRTFDGYWRRLHAAHPELMTPEHPAAFDSENSRAQRYRRLYPSKDIKVCREYLWNLEQGTAGTRLASLELEFNTLKTQLEAWTFSGGGNRQGYIRANQLQINAADRFDRATASNRIISCWRHETPQKLANDRTPIGLELDLSGLKLPSLPDIDVDFSHVGSLKLSNMDLSTSPEGFLTRFRHVRWLDTSHNQLRELPPAIGEMNGLTRLFLQKNQISLTAETARVLSERTTLRALWLHENPQLGITPDFSQIIDMRSVNLANTGIDTFPTGIADQPLLDTLDLSNNRIEEIPDAVIAPTPERLAHTVRVNNVTNITNNPLSPATRTRLSLYNDRLIEAETPLTGQYNLVDTARDHAPVIIRPAAYDPMARWTAGMTSAQVSTRTAQWQTLRDQQGSEGLFNTLNLLLPDAAGGNETQRRVWKVIDSITENSPESERLRRELFDRAGEATCCDRAAFTFANLEVRTMMHNARAKARSQAEGPQLSALSRGLFRLHEVDKIASADIAQREARIIGSRGPQRPEDLPAPAPHVQEEVEIRLFYRHRLKDRLQLPGQPDRMVFDLLISVSQAQLDAAYKKVIALDNSPEEFQALVSREFWQEFVTHKYRTQFESQRQPFQDRQATLDDTHTAGTLSFDDYDAQSKALQASLAIEEAVLIETLTRQELAEHSTRRTAEEVAGQREQHD